MENVYNICIHWPKSKHSILHVSIGLIQTCWVHAGLLDKEVMFHAVIFHAKNMSDDWSPEGYNL